ncbi:MAG TPA: hypothetical protein VFF67_09095 [Thermoplasmata archaeon]|nr:hypothetical protein [Thermoplasmata archaeon]
MRPLLPPPSVRRRWRFTFILAVAAVAALMLLAVAWYVPRPAPTATLSSGATRPPTSSVQIDGYDLIVSYVAPAGSTPNYFDSPDCLRCPLNLTPGAEWNLVLSLVNSDPARAHNVTFVTLGAPFSVVRVAPTPPVLVDSGASLAVTVTVALPAVPGYYFVPGSIGAS